MQRHVALDLALQRMSGMSGDGRPGQRQQPAEGPALRPTHLDPRSRFRVAFAALRCDLDLNRSLTTQRTSSTIGS